ncbi:MAG TPA: shikimate dehydrogenase [Tepidiformaceae bacterium]
MSRVAGIIGHPVAHSLSPIFQSAAFAHCGLDVAYERWDTPAEALGERIAALRDDRCLGANVTIPHKEAVIPYLDELAGHTGRVGAVNTIVNRDGRLVGYNTDAPGFVAALKKEARFDPAGKHFYLAGAGGAARGIAFGLADAAAYVTIANRSSERARRLADDVRAVNVDVEAVEPGGDLSDYDCVVNCTSVGMEGGPDPAGIPFDVAGLRPGALVIDIVYAPEETPLLRAARGRGLETLGGLPMLIYQGALAFELWTGVSAPVEVMFDAARQALASRK